MTHLVPDAVTPSPPWPPANPRAPGSSSSAAQPPSKAGPRPPPLASVCSICVDLISYFVLRIQKGCCFDWLWIVRRVSGSHQFGSFLWCSYQEMDQVLPGVWKFAFFFWSLDWVKLDFEWQFWRFGCLNFAELGPPVTRRRLGLRMLRLQLELWLFSRWFEPKFVWKDLNFRAFRYLVFDFRRFCCWDFDSMFNSNWLVLYG